MPAFQLFIHARPPGKYRKAGVDLVDPRHAAGVPQHGDEPQKDLRQNAGVVVGPVMLEPQAHGVGDVVQLVLVEIGQQRAGEGHRVDGARGTGQPQLFAGGRQKAHIKGGVVGAQGPGTAKFQKPGQFFFDGAGIPHGFV